MFRRSTIHAFASILPVNPIIIVQSNSACWDRRRCRFRHFRIIEISARWTVRNPICSTFFATRFTIRNDSFILIFVFNQENGIIRMVHVPILPVCTISRRIFEFYPIWSRFVSARFTTITFIRMSASATHWTPICVVGPPAPSFFVSTTPW